MLLQKSRLLLYRAVRQEPGRIYLPSSLQDIQPLPEPLFLTLGGYGGSVTFSDSLPVFDLAKPLCISVKVWMHTSPLEGPTLFMDASSKAKQGAVVWQIAVFTHLEASVQLLEIMAVAAAVCMWRSMTCNVVNDSAFAARLLARMGVTGAPRRWAPLKMSWLFVLLLSLSFMFTAIQKYLGSLQLETLWQIRPQIHRSLQEVQDLHASIHSGTRALARTCSIPISAARDVVQACPHCDTTPVIGAGINPRGLAPLQIWQMDFTYEGHLIPRKWLAVTGYLSHYCYSATQT